MANNGKQILAHTYIGKNITQKIKDKNTKLEVSFSLL